MSKVFIVIFKSLKSLKSIKNVVKETPIIINTTDIENIQSKSTIVFNIFIFFIISIFIALQIYKNYCKTIIKYYLLIINLLFKQKKTVLFSTVFLFFDITIKF